MKKILFCISSLFVGLVNAQEPTFQWAKAIGGNSHDYGNSIAVDGSGNVYTTGSFRETVDFDQAGAMPSVTSVGVSDIFISKMDATGTLVWAKTMGGNLSDYGNSIAIDGSGNVYITGSFRETVDFDQAGAMPSVTSVGGTDIFVLKLNASGDFVWAKMMGGNSDDYGNYIAVDGSGNVYTTGSFRETVDFDQAGAMPSVTSVGETDIFVLKLNASGDFVWAKAMGGNLYDDGNSIAVDETGNVYTTGYFKDVVDFNPDAPTLNFTSNGQIDIFVCKLNASGNLVWVKTIGGISEDYGKAVTVDGSGNVYTTGYFRGINVDFDPAAGSTSLLSSAGGEDIFILKLNASGDFVWAKRMGGILSEAGNSIALDAFGGVYTSGYFRNVVDFNPDAPTLNLTSNGQTDIFISKLTSDGNFEWAEAMGVSYSDDEGSSIAVDQFANVYTTGSFNQTVDFDPSAVSTSNLMSAGVEDIYIHKMSQSWLGIKNKNNESKDFMVYPNPISDILTIDLKNFSEPITRIELINSLGQVLINKTIFSKNLQLDTKDLSVGLYTLKMFNDNKIIATQKVIKQ